MIEPYYRDEATGITIYHGEALRVLDELSRGPIHDRPDHVITDPPYSPETHKGARSAKSLDKTTITFESMTPSGILSVFEHCSPRRWVIANVDYHAISVLEAGNGPHSMLRFIRHGIWVKPDSAPQFTGDRPGMGWEAVAVMHATDLAPRWNAGGNRAVWTYNVARGEHPTEKPIGLLRQWVHDFTDAGDLILDPFMGSGTTLRAAKDLGRRAVGIEINEDYCKLAVKRLRQEAMVLA